jgi:hypothetical protein
MENNKSALEFIKENSTRGQRSKGWGLTLDDKKIKGNIPLKFYSFDFYEADHDRIEEFFNMSNEEKFLLAYWTQRRLGKQGFGWGFIVGVVIMVFIFFCILNLY